MEHSGFPKACDRMKIAIDAHSIGTQTGGNETYFRQLLRGLAGDAGDHEYTVFYVHPAALEETRGDRRFKFARIPANPLLRIGLALPWQLRRIQPDVFHCQYIQPPWMRSRTVVTIHDLAHERFPEFFHPAEAMRMKRMVRATARKADHITTVSEFSAADIARRFEVPREKISVSYLAASEEFHPREKELCREHLARRYGLSSPFILYVGRIQARKNLPRLVQAYSRIRQQGISAKLVLVGKKDWQAERLVEKVKELRLEDSVIFPGYVSADDLPLFYNAAELFVFPSIFEGFGLPVLEGMASGVPTITSFGSSLEEVAGEGAMLVDPMNVQSIADAMLKVLGDRELQQKVVERGLLRSAEFSVPRLAARRLEVYRTV